MVGPGRGTSLGLLVLAATTLALAGCSSGPADVSSGDYRAFAASAEVGAVPPVMLTVDGTAFTFGEQDVLTTLESRPGEDEYTLCPPNGTGVPALLSESVSLGPTEFVSPAVFGDCGATAPVRLTVVDLASADGSTATLPFTRWVEFCDTIDPDC